MWNQCGPLLLTLAALCGAENNSVSQRYFSHSSSFASFPLPMTSCWFHWVKKKKRETQRILASSAETLGGSWCSLTPVFNPCCAHSAIKMCPSHCKRIPWDLVIGLWDIIAHKRRGGGNHLAFWLHTRAMQRKLQRASMFFFVFFLWVCHVTISNTCEACRSSPLFSR